MPRFPKGFGRRKTILPSEEAVDACPPVVESSFKVFERPSKIGKSLDSGSKFRPLPAAATRSSTLQLDENLFENIRSNHSGTSNTLTSVTDNSSRLSATSTVPSFSDSSNTLNQEWTSPHDKPFTDIPIPPAPRTSSTFSLKNTGRAMSWGRPKVSPNKENSPSPLNGHDQDKFSVRLKGGPSLSNTNTTVPPNIHGSESDLAQSEDLSDVFSTFENRSFQAQNKEKKNFLPDPNYLSNPSKSIPASIDTGKPKTVEGYTEPWTPQNSTEGLIEGKSTSPINCGKEKLALHVSSKPTSSDLSTATRRENIISSENECQKGITRRGRQQDSEDNKLDEDEDDINLLQESINASRRMNAQINDGQGDWRGSHVSSLNENNARWTAESLDHQNTSSERELSDENMFDSTIIARADLALRYQELSISPPKSRSHHSKIMTPAQFERYKQDQERLRNTSGSKALDDGEEEETYEDDDDEDAMEKAKALARQRRKQEAHMAVYRQQMRKVIGETPGNSAARPSMLISQSSPNLANFGQTDETEEEDEEVPLGILQAHGFPSKNKPPIRSIGSNPNLQTAVANSSGELRLPVFARNLPQDPYYGSGIVKPMHRESMAFAGGSPANNGISKGLPPGGLVGVIATEERSRAMRRGSPNPQGEYSSPLPSNSMGPMPISNLEPPRGLINLIGSGIQPPPTNAPSSMMLNPGDHTQIQVAQQMQQLQQMQQFMQMQMQFMQAMAQAGQQPSISPVEIPRPASAHVQQRLLPVNQNSAPWMNRASTYTQSIHLGNGYAPSIAPSERSNIGLPGRYRPVSQAPPINNPSRAASFCAPIPGWDNNKNSTRASTINLVSNLNTKPDPVSDDDDDEAWAEMAKKKSEKKSLWRNKKEGESSGLKEILGYLS